MKAIQQGFFYLHEKVKSIDLVRLNYIFIQKLQEIYRNVLQADLKSYFEKFTAKILTLVQSVRMLGVTSNLDEYEKRKLTIFNLLNFFQLISILIVPIVGLVDSRLAPASGISTIMPGMISVLVLYLNSRARYSAARISYFMLYPVFTSFIYLGGVNLGVELHFILFGVLSVFFLQDIGQMIFSVALSMVSYFVLSVLWKNYHYQLENAHIGFFVFNQVLVIVFIFYGLYLIKKENTGYQLNILAKTESLRIKHQQINKQKIEIQNKARLLEKQKAELAELNSIKNKLFSVIAHDLKAPMYALRNVFRNIQEQNMKASEIKALIPDIVNDFNYTTGLMENLLIWAKCQMQEGSTRQQNVDISELANDISHLLRLQASTKKIRIKNLVKQKAHVWADRDMIHLALRNLVSNAIKFTPSRGQVTIGITNMDDHIEIFVKDTGVGISQEALERIRQYENFTTRGTLNETGTGLGLMLCREFIIKNGGTLYIESEEGKGSTFSFTLPVSNTAA